MIEKVLLCFSRPVGEIMNATFFYFNHLQLFIGPKPKLDLYPLRYFLNYILDGTWFLFKEMPVGRALDTVFEESLSRCTHRSPPCFLLILVSLRTIVTR